MRRLVLLTLAVLIVVAFALSRKEGSDDYSAEKIIAMERAALDRWGKGDPQGYIETYAPDVTYFDPMQEKRVDGLSAMKQIADSVAGKIRVSRYEMNKPRVQRNGDVAVLTFNLISYGRQPDGSERIAARWNSTEVYARIDRNWKIIHSHWSFIKPELKQTSSESS